MPTWLGSTRFAAHLAPPPSTPESPSSPLTARWLAQIWCGEMALGSSSSSIPRAGGHRGRADVARVECPSCKTRIVVERMSRTEANPWRKFYTCTNRDQGSCKFFMWKLECTKDFMDGDAFKMSAAVDGFKDRLNEMNASLSVMKVAMAAQ